MESFKDIIQKKVYIDSAKSWSCDKLPSFKDNKQFKPGVPEYNEKFNNWGMFPYDLVINEEELSLENNIPYDYYDDGKVVLRFGNMANQYHKILNVIIKSKYYAFSNKNGSFEYYRIIPKYDDETEQHEIGDIIVFDEDLVKYFYKIKIKQSSLTNVCCEDDEKNITDSKILVKCGEVFCINEELDKLLNIKDDYGEELIKFFYKKKKELTESEESISIPYFNIPLFFEKTIINSAKMTADISNFDENKKYYINDVIYYNFENIQKICRLSKGNNFEIINVTGSLYESLCDSDFVIKTDPSGMTKTKTYIYQDDSNLKKIYYYVPYYIGPITDEYWEDLKEEKSPEEFEISGNTKSYLSFFERKREYDDEDNELPFNLNYEIVDVTDNNGNVIGQRKKMLYEYDSEENILYNTEMRYFVGEYLNATEKGDYIYADKITEITLSKEGKTVLTCTGGTEEKDNVIIIKYTTPDFDLMKVKYVKNIMLKRENSGIVEIEGSGVYYEETISVKKTIMENVYTHYDKYDETSGETKNFVYANLNFSSPITSTMRYNSKFSSMYDYYKSTDIDEEGNIINGINSYGDENMMDIFDINKEGRTGITRGKYFALEKFNILGELNTFEDLENYRNNYFGV